MIWKKKEGKAVQLIGRSFIAAASAAKSHNINNNQ